MKCSEAIKQLEILRHFPCPTLPADTMDAISLAIACLQFRMHLKEDWAFSDFQRFLDEDDEDGMPRAKA